MISLLNEIKIKVLSDFEQLKLLAIETFREIPKDIASARTKLNSEEKRGAQQHTGKYKQDNHIEKSPSALSVEIQCHVSNNTEERHFGFKDFRNICLSSKGWAHG